MKRLAVDATLRTAAPYQKSRKARAEAAGKTRKVYVEKVNPYSYTTSRFISAGGKVTMQSEVSRA